MTLEVVRAHWFVAATPWLAVPVVISVSIVAWLDYIGGTPLSVSVQGLLFGVFAVVVMVYAGLFMAFVRTVEISDHGVTFILGFDRVTAAWPDISPPKTKSLTGYLFEARGTFQDSRGRGLMVSKAQADAILEHLKTRAAIQFMA